MHLRKSSIRQTSGRPSLRVRRRRGAIRCPVNWPFSLHADAPNADIEYMKSEACDGVVELHPRTPGVPLECNGGGFKHCICCIAGVRDAWVSK